MSEQNPPPGQPTPQPEEPEGVGPTASEGEAPPPPPPDTAEDTTLSGDYPPPPPPAKKSRAPWIIGVAALLVLVLVGGAVAVILAVSGDDTHSITTPATAAGMKRDTAKETELKQQLAAAEQQFKGQFKNVAYVKSGIYNQTDTKRGPEGALVFIGAKVKKSDSTASKFVDGFRKQAGTNGFKVSSVSAGDGDAKGVCASQSTGQKITICGWATKDSGGYLIPTTSGWDTAKLAKIMRDLRADVEKTE